MSDYLIPTQAAIGWTLNGGDYSASSAGFTENLPQTMTYTAPPMHGRFSPLTADQPIYNFRVRATAICFNWLTMAMEELSIPLGLGNEFSVKLLFATKSEVPVTVG